MSSKRNKLLIFLGLVTVAVSKSHNDRFSTEHKFESKRTSASKLSANPRDVDPTGTDGFTSLDVPSYQQDNQPRFGFGDNGDQKSDKLLRRAFEHDYDLWKPEGELNFGSQGQFSRRVGSLHEDSSDLSVEIDPQEFYFEAQKVGTIGGRSKSSNDAGVAHTNFFSRRAGVLSSDTEKPTPESNKKESPAEAKVNEDTSKTAIVVNDKTTTKDSQKPNDETVTIKKKKPKMKKVLRVRPRGQNSNTTEKAGAKQNNSKQNLKEKLKDDSPLSSQRPRFSKHIKYPEIRDSANKDSSKNADSKATLRESEITSKAQKTIHSIEIKFPEVKTPVIKKESFKEPETKFTLPKTEITSNVQKPQYSTEVKLPEVKSSVFQKDPVKDVEIKSTSGQIPHAKETFRADRNSSSKKKKKKKKTETETETDVTEANDSTSDDQVGAFFRRTGKKIASKPRTETEHPDADWSSMYKTENMNKDDNFYMLSFNYMGNKNDPVKDILYLPKDSAFQEQQKNSQEVLQIKTPQTTGEYPSPELNIRHLEQSAEKFLGKQRKPLKNDAHDSSSYQSGERHIIPLNKDNSRNRHYSKKADSSEDSSTNGRSLPKKQYSSSYQSGERHIIPLNKDNSRNRHYSKKSDSSEDSSTNGRSLPKKQYSSSYQSGERHIIPLNKDNSRNRHYSKKADSSEDSSTNGRSLPEKQYSPKVALKRKKTKTHKNPVWKLQVQNKDFSDGQWKQSKASSHETQDEFRNDSEEHNEKSNNDGRSYFVRSFINLPSGDNVDINLNDDAIKQTFHQGQFKESNSQRKPLLPLENKGNGNYFVHMYKKVGNIENFDIRSGENTDKSGYLSSLRLSWDDDDTHAHVDEALDSRAFIPRSEHSYSTEIISSREDSRGDEYVPQPSENIMEYKHHYVDDFMSPLSEDKSYFFPDVPINHRHKRSTDKTPRVTTHFKMGESNSESNHTLNQTPVGKFVSRRLSPSLTSRSESVKQPVSQAQIQPRKVSEQPNIPVRRQAEINMRSYYHKPIENKEMKNLKSEFNPTDIFGNYETPSRGVTNVQIFQSYQSPNRDPKQAHGITYFHNDKNRNVKIQITDQVNPHSIHSFQTNRTKGRNVAVLNSFKPMSGIGVVQSSTDIKASYLKPEIEVSKTMHLNQSNADSEIAQANHTLPKSGSLKRPVFQNRIDKTTMKPVTAAFTTVNRTTIKVMDTIPEEKATTSGTIEFSRTTKSTASTGLNQTASKPTASTIPNRATTKYTSSTERDRSTTKSASYSERGRTTTKPASSTERGRSTKSRGKSTATSAPSRTTKSTATNMTTTKSVTSVPHRTTASTTTSDRTAKFSTAEESLKTTTPMATAAQFFHKTGDINARMDNRSPSNQHSRRIDDKPWSYTQQATADDKHKLQAQDVRHLETNTYKTKNVNEHEVLSPRNNFEHSSNVIHPKLSFQWQDAMALHLISDQNYPKYHSIPKTRFTCRKRVPGYYADPETGCQVFHLCQGTGVKHSFLCPNTTIFNQRLLVCDWYSKVTCDNSESFYGVNRNIYKHEIQRENNHKPQTNNNNWNNLQNKKAVTSKYSQPKKESYIQNNNQVTHSNTHKDTEVTDMPKFIVNHFKENIPHAEFGKPKSVTKSYSAVIAEPEPDVSPQKNAARDSHRSNDDQDPVFYPKLSNTNEKLIPDTFLEKQRAIKNSWNTKDMERKLNHELLRVPELSKAYHEGHSGYLNPIQDKSNSHNNYHLSDKGHSYYVPNLEDESRFAKDEEDEIHFAGRQNEKVVVVNKNRLHPDYESSESQDLQEPGKRTPGESVTTFVNPVPTTVATQTPNNRNFPGKEILNHKINPGGYSYFQNHEAHEINKGGISNQATKHNTFNNNAARNQNQNEPITPQYVYPLPGIVQNHDDRRKFNYGHRVDHKTVNGQHHNIFQMNAPRSNKNIFVNPDIVVPRNNKNILIKPETALPRFAKDILIKPENGNPKLNKNFLIKPNRETPRVNRNFFTKPSRETPRVNKNIHIKPESETPKFNENIHIKPDSPTLRFNKNILIETDSGSSGFTNNLREKPESQIKSDPQAEKIKWRIEEIKSGVESIGTQVGKILEGDENAFKNVRVFKLKPGSSDGELEEIRLRPFKFERQSRVPQNPKLEEEKREDSSFESEESDPNIRENTKLEFRPSIQVQPINGGKRYEGHSSFRANTFVNTDTNYVPTQIHMPVQKLVEQVVRDIAPRHKEVTKRPPGKEYQDRGTLRSYHPMIQIVPPNVRTVNQGVKREIRPVGTHENINVNQYQKLPRTSGRTDYESVIRRPPELGLKEKHEKNYEVKYIPLIKIDQKPNTEDKKLLYQQETKKAVPLYTNEKSEYFDHVFVPKKGQGRDPSDFLYPDKIKVQVNKEISYEVKSSDASNLGQTHSGVNENINFKFDSHGNPKVRKIGDLTGNYPQVKSSNGGDRESFDTAKHQARKKEVRTFVVLTKSVPVTEKFSNTPSNKQYQYDSHKTLLTPIQTKSQYLNQDINPSLECDDSSSSSDPNSFNTLTLQLGKNGPSQEFIKHIPPPNTSGTGRVADNVRIYYNSGDESTSKCRGHGGSKGKNQDISIPESEEEKQKALNKKPVFSKKPVFKELKRPKYVYTPDKKSAKFNTKTIHDTEQKIVSPKLKPIKLFQLSRTSRPAVTKPSSQRPTIPTITESKNYFLPSGKAELKKTFDESDEDSDKKSMERSKRVVNGKDMRYADLERAVELKTGIQKTEKNVEAAHFPAKRNGPRSKTAAQSSDESNESHSRHSRYADLEKAAELQAERMIRSNSQST